VDVLAVDEAISRLAEFDALQAQAMEMHFFGGLTFEEIVEELGVSSRTILRGWTVARAGLYGQLGKRASTDNGPAR
jgi:DNA-directed RNA polymerase specialized sigma24 family protein